MCVTMHAECQRGGEGGEREVTHMGGGGVGRGVLIICVTAYIYVRILNQDGREGGRERGGKKSDLKLSGDPTTLEISRVTCSMHCKHEIIQASVL